MAILTLQPANSDNTLSASAQDNNYGASQHAFVTGPASTSHILVYFDLSTVPVGMVITSAKLKLVCFDAGGNNNVRAVPAHRALTQFYEGDASGGVPSGTGSTWHYRNVFGTVAWAGGAGGGSASDYAAAATASADVSAVGTYEWEVAADVTDFLNGTATNYGWWLLGITGQTGGSKTFRSSQYVVTPTDCPSLDITYTAQPMVGTAAGAASVTGTLLSQYAIAVGAATGRATVTATLARIARHLITNARKTPAPLLRLSNGESYFDLLNPKAYSLCDWTPAVAQYKDGGYWNDSPQATGRRLKMRRFMNAIEVMEFSGKGEDQDQVALYTGELFRWLEAAADYWTSRWADKPVYLEARSAYETNTRYAIVHAGSIPQFKNPFAQPFFGVGRKVALDNVTLRLERGHWQDLPPGRKSCVNLSSIRDWTVTGWSSGDTGGGGTITGDVLSMIQTADGGILVGTGTGARIYRSTDEGQTWALLATLGSGTDRLNAFARDTAGNLYAALTGAAGAEGIWKSTNHGANWSRVKTHPSGSGYNDVVYIPSTGTLVGGGPKTPTNATSPIAMSFNGGITWSDPPDDHFFYDVKALATMDYPYLVTEYPGITPSIIEAFFGTDSFYTIGGRAGKLNANTGIVYSTVSGPMGNGGLDMAAYAYTTPSGTVNRVGLWAVRSSVDTDNSEIWRWPNPNNNGNSFGLISTIPDVLFNVLYTDPEPSYSSPNRTIWAGAAGEIWVSYNGGYTWSRATTAPTNPVRCFLRTTAGTLLAGGDGSEIFLYSGGSGSEGGGSGALSEAGGSVITNSQPLGQTETCEGDVFVSNKSCFTVVTHIVLYNGATYSNLQFDTDPPYTLLTDPPTTSNILYFGADSSDPNVPTGTFSSLVFDLTSAGRDLTIVWEFWDGGAWSVLDVRDHTEGFKIPGNVSVHWEIPSDWATVAVDGVTGFWVRARVSAVGSSPIAPVHDNRYIYTVNLPYVEIAEGEILGDLPALVEILWRNKADNPTTDPDLGVHRVLMGLRSEGRGVGFDAYLNLSDVQVPFGITLEVFEGGFINDITAPTSRAYAVSYSDAGDLNKWANLLTVSLNATAARAYQGDFRAFLRVQVIGGDENDWRFRLALGYGSGSVISFSNNQPYAKPVGTEFVLLDLGSLQVPDTALSTGELFHGGCDVLTLTVQGYATATSVVAVLYDIILLPLDEWAGDFVHTNPNNPAIQSEINGNDYLDVDSVTDPKSALSAYNRLRSGLVKVIYQPISNGEAILQQRAKQRLWFLAATYNFSDPCYTAEPEITGAITVSKVQQYLFLRGRQ